MKKLLLILILLTIVLVACNSKAETNLAASKNDVVNNYADIVYANYEDSLTTAVELHAALETFIANPSEETHQAAKDAWLAAREPYGQTEAFRFYGGPIDDENGPEGLLNAWPLDEAYIDYVAGMPESGIINNLTEYPEITAELLESLNEVGAEENISTGYHSIEFLLWGQDLSANGNGERPYTDYTTAPNAERRGHYLLAASDLLVSHLGDLVDAWAPDNDDNYRASFVTQTPDIAIQQMLTSLGVLSKSELAGERIFVAYDNQDQEDEHSCFSDNTHRDIINNAQGIYNVYTGSYVRTDGSEISGASLADLVAQMDEELAAELLALANAATESTQSIPIPFDQAIVVADQRPMVLASVNALQDLGDKFAEVANILGLSINTNLPG